MPHCAEEALKYCKVIPPPPSEFATPPPNRTYVIIDPSFALMSHEKLSNPF